MLNVFAPINPLGYGVAGTNIAKELQKKDDISLFIIGEPYLPSESDQEVLQKSVANSRMPDWNAPCLKIWHQHDMSLFVGKGERIGFPFFELDDFSDMEAHHLNSLDRLFVASPWAKDVCLSRLKLPEDKINIIPLGVDTSVFRSAETTSKDTVFLNCGKWEIRKGHDLLVEIFNKAFTKSDNVKLIMMPDNPFLSPEETNQWKQLYSGSELGSKIQFIDRVATHEEVYNIMSESDCGVFPSRAEGWNLELLEMMSIGKEVIATNYAGHTAFCNDNNARLVEISELESAFDGKWFDGKIGEWAKLSNDVIDGFVQHLRDVHKAKQSGDLKLNHAGVETGRNFGWANTASTIQESLNINV